jgi:hypothetical protein
MNIHARPSDQILKKRKKTPNMVFELYSVLHGFLFFTISLLKTNNNGYYIYLRKPWFVLPYGTLFEIHLTDLTASDRYCQKFYALFFA